MIAGEKDLRHGETAELTRAGVLGAFDEPTGAREGILPGTLLVPEHAGASRSFQPAPGTSRDTASTTSIAATSPPERTKSPTEISSAPSASRTRASNPS